MYIPTASMSLGILDFLIDWLTTFLMWIVQFFIDLVITVFARLIYTVGALLMRFADMIQDLFRKLAGLGEYWYRDETGKYIEKSGDIVLDILINPTVLQVLIALTLVAIAMIIAGTIVQIIRSEYTTEGSRNTKAGILGQSFKSLVLFAVVPVTCLGGIFVSSYLLKAIDLATNPSGASTISGQIFVAAAADANKARMGDVAWAGGDGQYNLDGTGEGQEYAKSGHKWITDNATMLSDFAGITVPSGDNSSIALAVADAIDKKFAQSRSMDTRSGGWEGVGESFGELQDTMLWNASGVPNYLSASSVAKCYNLVQVNFIVLIFGSALAMYMLLTACFGLVMRLFNLAVLFMISPPIIGIMPIDGGNAFKQWRSEFIKKILAAYGTVVSLNLLFLLLPIFQNINLYPNNIFYQPQNNFIKLVFVLVGLFMMKDISGMVSSIIGADNAAKDGEGMAKKVGGAVAKTAMAGAGIAGGAISLGAKAYTGISAKITDGKGKKAASIAEDKAKSDFLSSDEGKDLSSKASAARTQEARARSMGDTAAADRFKALAEKREGDLKTKTDRVGTDAKMSVLSDTQAKVDKIKTESVSAKIGSVSGSVAGFGLDPVKGLGKKVIEESGFKDLSDGVVKGSKFVGGKIAGAATKRSKERASELEAWTKNRAISHEAAEGSLSDLKEQSKMLEGAIASGDAQSSLGQIINGFTNPNAAAGVAQAQMGAEALEKIVEEMSQNGKAAEETNDLLRALPSLIKKAMAGDAKSQSDLEKIYSANKIGSALNNDKTKLDKGITETQAYVTQQINNKQTVSIQGITGALSSKGIDAKDIDKIKTSIEATLKKTLNEKSATEKTKKEEEQTKAILQALEDIKKNTKKK